MLLGDSGVLLQANQKHAFPCETRAEADMAFGKKKKRVLLCVAALTCKVPIWQFCSVCWKKPNQNKTEQNKQNSFWQNSNLAWQLLRIADISLQISPLPHPSCRHPVRQHFQSQLFTDSRINLLPQHWKRQGSLVSTGGISWEGGRLHSKQGRFLR